MSTPSYWQASLQHLSDADPVMAKIIAAYPGEGLTTKDDAFFTLTRSIVGQQISTKAADSIWNRLEQGIERISPHALRSAEIEALRSFGLSGQKVAYLHSLADYFIARENPEKIWANMDDETIIKDLTTIKGIGRWTAEMFLIFHLTRQDILPLGDLGVLKALERAYEVSLFDESPKKAAGRTSSTNASKSKKPNLDKKTRVTKKLNTALVESITKPWQPYRTVATWYLWRSLDPVPIAY